MSILVAVKVWRRFIFVCEGMDSDLETIRTPWIYVLLKGVCQGYPNAGNYLSLVPEVGNGTIVICPEPTKRNYRCAGSFDTPTLTDSTDKKLRAPLSVISVAINGLL